jgi:hypothetical protein
MGFLRFNVGDGVDTKEFSWVPLYVKELGYLEEIKALEKEIAEVQKSPKAKADLLVAVKAARGQVEALRVQGVAAVLKKFQDGGIAALSPEQFSYIVAAPGVISLSPCHTAAHAFEGLLADPVVKAALKLLPDGMTSHEKEAKIATLQGRIQKLQEKIEKECWPKERRVFDTQGDPLPRQDRWTALVNQWRKVMLPYNAPVDFEGYAMEKGSPGWKAFHKLGFDKHMIGSTKPRSRRA